ncbi:MAG TPA: hypothetical protein VH640_17355 [Bryobacteraceae bacterium]|jgi:hypothetical protein
MPVTWTFQDSILVLTLVGEYTFEEPVDAVNTAIEDPRFRRGTSLLIDARQSTTRRSSEEFRGRSVWMASLLAKGLSPRCAIVVSSAVHQYGMARMAGIYLDLQGMTLEIFTELAEALDWLLGRRYTVPIDQSQPK